MSIRVFTLFIVLLLSGNLAYSQPVTKNSSYYQIISTAEKDIYSGDLNRAIFLYDSAFTITNKAVDLFNASCCAFYSGQNAKAFAYLDRYFKKGARYYLTEDEFTKYYPGLSKTVFDSILALKEKYPLKTNEFTHILDSLYTLDQYYHVKRLTVSKDKDSTWFYDRTNWKFLMSYLKVHGFDFETDSFISFQTPTNPKYDILFRHFFQESLIEPDDLAFLKEQISKNKLNPNLFANWLELYQHDDLFGLQGTWVLFPVSKDTNLIEYYKSHRQSGQLVFTYDHLSLEKKQLIDKKRAEFSLEPFAAVETKVRFVAEKEPVYLLDIPDIQLDYK